MATLTCGIGGSTNAETVAQINTNTTDIATKITKVSGGTEGNITTLTVGGEVQDGGLSIAEVLDTDNHTDGLINGVYTLAERAKLATLTPLSDDTRKIISQDYIFTATNGQTFFSGLDDNGQVLDINKDDIAAYINRSRYHTPTEFKAINETRVDTNESLIGGETVVIHTSDFQEPSEFIIEYSMAAIKVLDSANYVQDFARPYYHAPANASNHLAIVANSASFNANLVHDLGVDEHDGTMTTSNGASVTLTSITNGFNVNHHVADATYIRFGSNITVGKTVKITFNAVINSGTPIFSNYYYDSNMPLNYEVVNGLNEIVIQTELTGTNVTLQYTSELSDVDYTLVDIKEVALPVCSYFSRFDTATSKLIQLSSSGDVGENLVVNGDFSDIDISDWTTVGASVVLNELQLQNVGATDAYAYQEIPVGGRIAVSYTIRNGTSTTTRWQLKDGPVAGSLLEENLNQADGTYTNTYTPTQSSVTPVFSNNNTDLNVTSFWDDIEVRDILPISTTTIVDTDTQFFFSHNAPLSDADIAEIEADPNTMFRVAFNGYVLPSGFALANLVEGDGGLTASFYGGNEGSAGGAYLQNLLVDFSAELVSNTTINKVSGDATITTITNGSNIVDTTTDANTFFISLNGTLSDAIVKYSFNAVVNSGGMNIYSFYLDGGYVPLDQPHTIVDGLNEILVKIDTSTDRMYFKDGDGIYDIDITDSSVREATALEIANFSAPVRLDNQTNGATNLKLIQDSSGRTTATVTDNTTQWKDGANAPTGWTVTPPYTITEEIGADTYTFTSDLNRYKNAVADGTFTAPVGIWTLGELAFDGVTPTPSRGSTKMIDAVVVP